MTKLSQAELQKLLLSNPHLALVTDGTLTTLEPTPAARQVAQAGKWSEHDFQKAVFDWCDKNSLLMPEISLLMAIPNGQYRKGQRPEPGMMPGASDLFLPVASGQYHGLWIELKVGSNKPSRAQLAFMRRVQHQGYKAIVIWDEVEKVIATITDYLGGL